MSYTFKVKAKSSDLDYVDSDFCEPIVQTTDYEIRLSSDFTTTVAFNQTTDLGTISIDDFTYREKASLSFKIDGAVNAQNFSYVWNETQNGFVISFNNDNEMIAAGVHTVRIIATESDQTASTEFSLTVTPTTNINGLVLSGTQDTDWVWNETAKNLLVKGDIIVTGTASSDMTISVEQGASVNNNEVIYTGISENNNPGTLAISMGQGITDKPTVTAGVLDDKTCYYVGTDTSFTVNGTTYTATSQTGGKLQFGSDAVYFHSGQWNVDVKDGDVLTVATTDDPAAISVHFSANDKFALSGVTYTVGNNGGGFTWNVNESRMNMTGITLATTENRYSGVTFSSTSSSAYGVDASDSIQYLSYNFQIHGGDWTATSNDDTKVEINPTMILQNGSLTAQLKNGNEKKFTYSEAKVDGVNAYTINFVFDRSDATINTITTSYEISGFLYSCVSEEQMITCSTIDTRAKTISLNQGSWFVDIEGRNARDSTVLTTLSDSATLCGTENDSVYSSPTGAIDSTFEVVEFDVEVEGYSLQYRTRIQYGVDNYHLGSVVISADHGKHTPPVIDNDLLTMTITGGDWYVSDFLTGKVGGTVVLKGGSFTDTEGVSVIFHGQVIPLTLNGKGVLDLTTLTTVTTAEDVVDNYDGVTSLREAIAFANANANTTWGNVITFSDKINWADPANTITLDTANGSLIIDHTLTIDAKAQNVTIDGNYTGSVFTIEDKAGALELPVEIKGLTITGGTGTVDTEETFGGAIYNNGVVVVTDMTFTGNIAKYGGAVANFKLFTIVDSTLTDNRGYAQGGAFYNKGTTAQLTIADSTIARNIADYGGGTYNNGGNILLVNSIVVGSMDSQGNAVTDVYISDNPGLNYANYSVLGSVNNQKTGKSGLDAFDGGASGVLGSIAGKSDEDVFDENGFDGRTIRIENNSIAATSGTLTGSIGQTIYYYNQDDGYWWDATQNTQSTYRFNANDTTSYGLTDGSIVVDGQNMDDEGNPVSRVLSTRFFAAGAYAINEAPETPSVVVTTNKDIVNPYDSVISLREAISYADASANWGNVITFSDKINWADPANTITLDTANGSLIIDHTLTIDAKAQNVTIDGNYVRDVSEGVGSVFTIKSTAGTAELPVSIKGVTITGGNGTGDDGYKHGGAILNYGVVTVEYSVFQNNKADYGAGIANFNQFTILNSTLTDNVAGNDGGAFYNKNASAQMTIGNTTVAANNAINGGAVYNDGGKLFLVNSILAGNSGSYDIVMDKTEPGQNYVYYSILGSVINEATQKYNLAAFTGVWDSKASMEYASVFGKNIFDGQTIPINRNTIAANSGTLVGFIGQTCYYYNWADGYWWDATTNTKSGYAFNADDTTYYGLTNGYIVVDGQNLDDEGSRVSRVVTTKAFSVGAYTIERIPDTPSTVVTITDDIFDPFDDEISLREAIFYAGTSYVDANGITHTLGTDITFDTAAFANGGTIMLAEQNSPFLKQENAALIIDKSLSIDTTINGELKDIIVDGSNINDSVFYLTDSAGTDPSKSKVLLKGLTITGGKGHFDYTMFGDYKHYGGAILNTGALELFDCVIKENKAYQGGGIFNLGYLSVKDSDFSANEAEEYGGAILNSGYMILNGVTMTNNSAWGGGGITNNGIATLPAFLGVEQVTAVMSNVRFENNSAKNGGALYDREYFGNLSVTIDNCSFKENSAEVNGGAIALLAVSNFKIDIAINNSSFIANTAQDKGGAISIEAVCDYDSADIKIDKCGTIELVLCNSLIVDNTAKVYGGGVANSNGSVTMRNVTIAGNKVENTEKSGGGGIYSMIETDSDRIALYNTIIAENYTSEGTANDITLDRGISPGNTTKLLVIIRFPLLRAGTWMKAKRIITTSLMCRCLTTPKNRIIHFQKIPLPLIRATITMR